MKKSVKMVDFIDWKTMLDPDVTKRYAGSHVEHLSNLFLHSQMIASETSGDYQGYDVVVILFTPPIPHVDPKIIIVSDYYGSCSGCDAWEDASDESLKKLLISISNNARLFDTFDETIKYLQSITREEQYELFPFKDNLIKQVTEAERNLGGDNKRSLRQVK